MLQVPYATVQKCSLSLSTSNFHQAGEDIQPVDQWNQWSAQTNALECKEKPR